MPEGQEAPKTPLEVFREEIGEKIRQEMTGEVSSVHFLKTKGEREPVLTPKDLTEADRIAYEVQKAGKLTDEAWQRYEHDLLEDFRRASEEAKERGETLTSRGFPRFHFRAYLKNLQMIQELRKKSRR